MPTPKDNSTEREVSFADLYRFYRGFVRSYRGTLALACLFLFGAVLMEVARPWPLKIVFDYVLPTSRRLRHEIPWLAGLDSMTVLLVACATVIAVAIGFGMFEYAHTVLVAKVGQKVVFKIRQRLFTHVQRLSLSFHSRNRSGDLLSRLIRDVNQLRDFLSDSAVQWVGETVFVTGMIAVMLWLDWRLALLSFVLFPLLVLSISRYSGQIRGLTRRRLKKEGSVASIFNETLAAIQEVQLFTPEGEENRRFSEENRSSYKTEMRAFRTKSKLMRVVELLTAAGTCLVLWYGARRVVEGQLSAGDLLVFLAYLKSLYKPVRRIANLSVQASKTFASAERVMQILSTVPEIQDAPDAIPASRFHGDVEFRGLEFEYETGRPVLSGIELRVRAGQTVAVVGSSGAGKSTLVSLIPRLYDPTAGAVLIDGVDIRRYKLASLRDQITVVPQDPVLFGSTIRDNIAMGDPSCDFEQIQRAARLACAEEFIDRLPHGYDTELGERASNLSGGQRQRIAIARALLRDAPIVILDEPMAGLDIFSETLVLRGLRNLLRDKTAFVIAHRLSTILKSDLVIVVENGRIVESGSPQQLIQGDGPFRKLAELQFGAVNVERMLLPVYGGWAHGA